MRHRSHYPRFKNGIPVERRDVVIACGRVVQVATQHVGASVWVATGLVSEPLPSGPQLKSPVEVTATGRTESEAIEKLKHRVEEFDLIPGHHSDSMHVE